MVVLTAVGTVFSGGFALFSWWHEKGSRKARDQARQYAEDAHTAATALEQIADNTRRPQLEAAWLGKHQFALRNTSNKPVHVERIINEDEFVPRISGLKVDSVIEAGRPVPVKALAVNGARLPSQLVLQVAGIKEPLIVDLPPRP